MAAGVYPQQQPQVADGGGAWMGQQGQTMGTWAGGWGAETGGGGGGGAAGAAWNDANGLAAWRQQQLQQQQPQQQQMMDPAYSGWSHAGAQVEAAMMGGWDMYGAGGQHAGWPMQQYQQRPRSPSPPRFPRYS